MRQSKPIRSFIWIKNVSDNCVHVLSTAAEQYKSARGCLASREGQWMLHTQTSIALMSMLAHSARMQALVSASQPGLGSRPVLIMLSSTALATSSAPASTKAVITTQ